MGAVRAGRASCSVAAAGRWPTTVRGSRGAGGDHLRGHVRLHVAAVAPIVRAVGSDGSPAVHGMEQGAGVDHTPPPGPGRTRLPRRAGLVEVRDRLGEHAGPERGDLTGPNPVDRGKKGPKIHLITERTGLPLSIGISGANHHDGPALEPLVRGIPPVRSPCGPRRRRPAKRHADKGYDYDHPRRRLRKRGIRHRVARKGIESSTRLGRHHWTIERTMPWLRLPPTPPPLRTQGRALPGLHRHCLQPHLLPPTRQMRRRLRRRGPGSGGLWKRGALEARGSGAGVSWKQGHTALGGHPPLGRVGDASGDTPSPGPPGPPGGTPWVGRRTRFGRLG